MPAGNKQGTAGACPEPSGAANTRAIQEQARLSAAGRKPLRAVFMGTPDFAATILERLLASPQAVVSAVYTQPDRPAGRGKKLTAPPVKRLALARGIPVFQPPHFKQDADGDAAVAELAAQAPDVLIVAAYGLILPQRVLDIPRHMPINVHASLLPKYRGAAPIQRAVMNGDKVTGVTIMRMERGLDTGPMLMQRAVGIGVDDTAATLHDELAREGAELLELALERLRAGALCPIPQEHERATYAAKLSKEESLVDFTWSAAALHNHIRGVTPWPGASMRLRRAGQEDLTVHLEPGPFPLSPAMQEACDAAKTKDARPGGIVGMTEGSLLVACAEGCYAFSNLRPAGGKSMDAKAFCNGYLKDGNEAFHGREHTDS